eukprot:590301-Amphidinium_carterae.1
MLVGGQPAGAMANLGLQSYNTLQWCCQSMACKYVMMFGRIPQNMKNCAKNHGAAKESCMAMVWPEYGMQ